MYYILLLELQELLLYDSYSVKIIIARMSYDDSLTIEHLWQDICVLN